jgi:hypothetical protein
MLWQPLTPVHNMLSSSALPLLRHGLQLGCEKHHGPAIDGNSARCKLVYMKQSRASMGIPRVCNTHMLWWSALCACRCSWVQGQQVPSLTCKRLHGMPTQLHVRLAVESAYLGMRACAGGHLASVVIAMHMRGGA